MNCKLCGQSLSTDGAGMFCNNPACPSRYVDVTVAQEFEQTSMRGWE